MKNLNKTDSIGNNCVIVLGLFRTLKAGFDELVVDFYWLLKLR